MPERVTKRRRVGEEGLRVVKLCQELRNVSVLIPHLLDEGSKGSHG